MICYISGEAARAVMLRTGKYLGIELDGKEETNLHAFELPMYLRHSIDVERVECQSVDDLRRRLEVEWAADRAFKLSLIAFDARVSDELRKRAALSANDLLANESCQASVLKLLSSATFPNDFDSAGVGNFIDSLGVNYLAEVLADTLPRQELIASCITSWNEVASTLDYDSQDIARARYRLGRIGVFRDFVTLESSGNDTILKILVDPILNANKPLSRDIVSLWASKYKDRSLSQNLRIFTGRAAAPAVHVKGMGRVKKRLTPHEAFTSVNRKIGGIKKEFSEGNYKKADALVEYLISDQAKDSDAEFVAKSLCNIAIFCRGLGDINRYFQLTKRAVDLAPEDAWAIVQLGNAYLITGKHKDALACFERAEIAGDERSALIGRAETLRATGQQHVALSILDRCISSYPQDDVAKNARASLLAYFGEMQLALDEYNGLVASPMASSHAYSGRALVYDDMGHTDRAIADVDIAIALAPGDMIPVCAKADVLRRARRFTQASKTLEVKKASPDGRLMLEMAGVRVLRDSGEFEKAMKKARHVVTVYPEDLSAKVAIADILRRTGRYEDALAQYKAVEDAASFNKIGRYGYAATFAALKRYDEAVPYLSNHTATTFSDWVSRLLLGMISIRKGHLEEAEGILTQGNQECPWVRLRAQFGNSLVHLKLRQSELEAAKSIYETTFREDDLDDASLVLGAHLRYANGEGLMMDSSGLSNELFKLVLSKMGEFAASNDSDLYDEVLDLEWLALTSVSA